MARRKGKLVGNSRTRATTFNAIMRSRAFKQGFAEVKAGKPFNPESYCDDKPKQWCYEWGRMFAILAPDALLAGSRVPLSSQIKMSIFFAAKDIP